MVPKTTDLALGEVLKRRRAHHRVEQEDEQLRSKEEILKVLRTELPYLRERFRVRRIGLFGSYARGGQEPGSDIDILVELEPPMGLFGFIHLRDYLSERLGAKVDLVTPDALKPLIRTSILEGTVYA